MSGIVVKIDGEVWEPANDDTAEYDAIHAAAGAVLAGANSVEVIRTDETERPTPPHEVCPKCEGHGGVPGDKCDECGGTGRADGRSNI